jgi:type II secretory ATPase GspE/PulE/Tfp pilus assembly ATPase PilB-like protein
MKYSSNLKLNISNIPQDGKYAVMIDDRKIDVRVSTLPIAY